MIELRLFNEGRDLPDPLSDVELCAWLGVDVWRWRGWRATGHAPIAILILRDCDGVEVDALTSRAAVQWWWDDLPEVRLLGLISPADLPDDGDQPTGGAL